MIVNLITYRNKLLRTAFERENIDIAEFSPVMEPQFLKEDLILKKANYSLFELPLTEQKDIKRLNDTMKLLYNSTKLVCICEKITPFIRSLLLENGITDCIEHFNTERIVSYIRLLHTQPSQKSGSFLVLDDDPANRNMLTGIIKRFGYNIKFVTGSDSLFEELGDKNYHMILINLGTNDLDLNSIVRKSYGSSEIKRFPVIAYKSLNKGLFVHEVLAGLNRLTKAIYSPEELYCILVDILFKKEILAVSSEYCTTLDFDKFKNFASASIPQIYHDIQNDPFSRENIFSTERIDTMASCAESITASLVKIDGIRWLRLSQSQEKKPTCGVGV